MAIGPADPGGPACGGLAPRNVEADMRRWFRIAWLVTLALLASGCALLGGSPPERYGGDATLTEAATEARRDSSDKQRWLDVGDQVPTYPPWTGPESGTSLTVSGDADGSSSHAGGPGLPDGWHLGILTGGGSLGGPEFEGFSLAGLDVGGFVSPRWRFDLGALVLSPNLTAASVAGQGLKGEFEMALDLSARYYLTPPHTFMGVYPLAGVRFGTLFWNYRKPVNVIADGRPKQITDDYLNTFALYGGAGISLVQARHFHSGVNFTGGVRLYDATTFEGFHNTLFPSTGYTQLAIEVAYKF